MKRILLLPLMLLALSVSACGTIGNIANIATTTVTNPVDAVDIYRLKNTYAASLELMVKYREYCWSKPYAALMADPVAKPTCQSRRPAVRAMQSAQLNARKAVVAAEDFARNYPTLNAATAIAAAWSAVTTFQNTLPRSL
jgi:hypothetical protein